MDFEQFQLFVRNEVRHYLPEEKRNAEITLHEMHKLSENYMGMVVKSHDDIQAPIINLNQMYERYCCGERMNEVLHEIADVVDDFVPHHMTDELLRYEKVKDKIFIRLSSPEKNHVIAEKVPHRMFADLMVTYHILMDSDDDGLLTTMITNVMMESYLITEEQLYQDALKQTEEMFPAVVEGMNTFMETMFQMEPSSDMPYLTVVSNQKYTYGSSVLLYPGMMDYLASYEGGDFVVLPSSIHEIIIVKENEDMDFESLEEMVRSINEKVVKDHEQLSDHVYHYDSEAKLFETTDTYMKRIRMMFA